MRESYRKNNSSLINSMIGIEKNVVVAFLFADKRLPEYKLVEEKMIAVLNQLSLEVK